MSNDTRHALKVIRDYLAGENEAVQYCFEYMADLVTQGASGITGGIQAGNVPANDVVTDPSAECSSSTRLRQARRPARCP